MRSASQQGMSFFGFLCVLVVAGCVLSVVLKIGPPCMDYYSLKKSMDATAQDARTERASGSEIRASLAQRLNTNYVDTVKASDIKIVEEGERRMVADYEVRKTLVANVDLVVHFHHEAPLQDPR